jgi:hypothetical protein
VRGDSHKRFVERKRLWLGRSKKLKAAQEGKGACGKSTWQERQCPQIAYRQVSFKTEKPGDLKNHRIRSSRISSTEPTWATVITGEGRVRGFSFLDSPKSKLLPLHKPLVAAQYKFSHHPIKIRSYIRTQSKS